MATKVRLSDRNANHLAKSVLLEESGSPIIVRLVIASGIILLIVFFVWSYFMELDEVARASGKIIPVGHVKKVQHLGGGKIKEILVKDGDFVKEGQVLLRLNPENSQSQMDQSNIPIKSLPAKIARLEAFIDGVEPDFSKVLDKQAVKNEQRQYLQTIRSLKLQRAILNNQALQTKAELEELRELEKAERKQLSYLQEEMVMREKLFKKGLNAKPLYLSLQRNLSEIEGELAQIPPRKRKLREKIKEINNQILQNSSNANKQALDELAAAKEYYAQSQEVAKRDRNSLYSLELKAPVEGYIHGLTKHTIGGVITSGSTILEIVPLNRSLEGEIQISSKDIGHVRVGQVVVLKFTTYDFARYGGLEGTLRDISATTVLDESGEPYYKGLVSLNKDYLGDNPNSQKVLPGLTLQADIITGQKTVLEYLLKPIFASARQALQER
ncbi:MAG: HlyD family type I secretion periplasmic adaptor subunit [Magnetococcales bacterium]|nr:HlyD family type I secretion periplasmic adaptor subunit [Magnetococcales bacterium]